MDFEEKLYYKDFVLGGELHPMCAKMCTGAIVNIVCIAIKITGVLVYGHLAALLNLRKLPFVV